MWDGALTNTQINSIEAIQRRAARLVRNVKRTDHITSTTKVLEDLEWDKLKDWREWRRLSISGAMHYNKVAINITGYLSPHPTNAGQSRTHQLQYFIPHCNTRLHQNSFFMSTARLLNGLPKGSSLLQGPQRQAKAMVFNLPTLRCRTGTKTDRRDAILPQLSNRSWRSTYKYQVLSKDINLFFGQFGYSS